MSLAEVAAGLGQGAVEVAHGVHHPLGGLGIGRTGRQAGVGPSGRHDRDVALHTVEHRHHRRAQHQRVGQAKRIGIHIRQVLDQADHVVAQIAVQAGTGGGQVIGEVDLAGGDQGAQVFQRAAVFILEGGAVIAGLPVDAALFAMALPDEVGLHADDRVASAHFAACHRFQHEGILRGAGQLEHQRYGRIEICRKPGIDNLVLSGFVALGEGLERGGQFHLRGPLLEV